MWNGSKHRQRGAEPYLPPSRFELPLDSEALLRPLPEFQERVRSEGRVDVIFTTWNGTRAALRMANRWALCLESRIVLWFAEVVPRQFALRRPPASVEFTERRLTALAAKYCQGLNVEIQLCLCTDLQRCLATNLPPESMVFLGGRVRWWRTWEKELGEFLRDRGHTVLYLDAAERRRTELLAPDDNSV